MGRPSVYQRLPAPVWRLWWLWRVPTAWFGCVNAITSIARIDLHDLFHSTRLPTGARTPEPATGKFNFIALCICALKKGGGRRLGATVSLRPFIKLKFNDSFALLPFPFAKMPLLLKNGACF